MEVIGYVNDNEHIQVCSGGAIIKITDNDGVREIGPKENERRIKNSGV